MKILNILGSVILLLYCCACSNKQSNTSAVVSNDISALKSLTIRWNECLVRKDLQALRELYAERVTVYGTTLSIDQVALIKATFLQKYHDFNQKIAGDIVVSKLNDQEYKVIFPKHSSYSGKSTDVEGYLLFKKIADAWKITTESDNVTDRNLSITKENLTKQTPTTCLEAVLQILITSPAYINATTGLAAGIVKNGGKGYGLMLEGSPYPDQDAALQYSETYDFKLYENYADHSPVVERFSFDPIKKQLYLYEVVENELFPIEFNKKLLPGFNKICEDRLVKKISAN